MIVRILQRGFNFSQDGPGNRLVYHLQGCNMRCPWCSNPESMARDGCIVADGDAADALCPFGAVHDGMPDAAKCRACAMPCLEHHSRHLRQSCTEEDVRDVLREVERSRALFFDGGGVTFTGGEATMQFDALELLLTALHNAGIHTAIETNGSHPRLPELFDRIDYLILDCKHYDDETHRRTIGAGCRQTLENLRLAAKMRSQLLVRIPLIGGFNDSARDAAAFADVLSVLYGCDQCVEVLRYHEYGKDKWKQCGMTYAMHDAFVSDDTYRQFCDTLRRRGLRLTHT
ncbi:MAG: glycyl-radical enzyme activating protein [Clostridia bacterium]|nr:glycyl-radical enzyme activating protein [Clostridia bacterium]